MGCKSSKDASQPVAKGPGKQKSQAGAEGSANKSPSKAQLKDIKVIPEEDLKKHKVSDIIGFVKNGNLPMVHGLIEYYKLGQSVVLLSGSSDEFEMPKGPKVSMKDWNPLLVAIAFKKIDIVRYFLQKVKLSLLTAGRAPASEKLDDVQSQLFCLKLAVANKDLNMLEELFSVNFTCWDVAHLCKLVSLLAQEKWTQGLQAVFKSYTADMLYSSQPYEVQHEIVVAMLKLRKDALGSAPEVAKIFDERLIHAPFALITIYALLKD